MRPSEKVMHAFRGGSGGAHPGPGSLTEVDGTLYGTTQGGGRIALGLSSLDRRAYRIAAASASQHRNLARSVLAV
jgi:hypothetical protein